MHRETFGCVGAVSARISGAQGRITLGEPESCREPRAARGGQSARFLRDDVDVKPESRVISKAGGASRLDRRGSRVECAPMTWHASCSVEIPAPSTVPVSLGTGSNVGGEVDLGFAPGAETEAETETDTAADVVVADDGGDSSARQRPDVWVDRAAIESSFASMGARARIVDDLHKSAYHRVFCFVRRRECDEVAEEVAHEVFVRLLRVRNLERMTISVAYLLRIAENLLKRRHERARRYRNVLEGFGIASEAARGGAREESLGGGLLHGHAARVDGCVDAGRLDAVLAQLTREEQAAVRLIVCEGLDYQSAARSLGVPVSTVNNWKHRGLSKLKQLVGSPGRPSTATDPRAVG
jgi:RNA polymerase sigma factor (sigma-70 family)